MSTSSEEKSFARSLWLASGLPSDVLSRLKLSDKPDPSVDSSFRIGTAAQVSLL